MDPIAGDCGASNTLVALPGGGFSAHNTDWLGAIGAIEAGLAGDDLRDSYARAASETLYPPPPPSAPSPCTLLPKSFFLSS